MIEATLIFVSLLVFGHVILIFIGCMLGSWGSKASFRENFGKVLLGAFVHYFILSLIGALMFLFFYLIT
jgi:hypothetical protein